MTLTLKRKRSRLQEIIGDLLGSALKIRDKQTRLSVRNILQDLESHVFHVIKAPKTVAEIKGILTDKRYQERPTWWRNPENKEMRRYFDFKGIEEDLLIIKSMDFDNDWDKFKKFLKERMAPKENEPYNFKLRHSIATSYASVLMMQAYEKKNCAKMYDLLTTKKTKESKKSL